jgi:hypothetical protein
MRDKETVHKRVQEEIDCFATSDPLKEMSELGKAEDPGEAAVKWLALATLHGINMNAKEISILKSEDGKIKVTAEYRPAELPSPGSTIGQKIMEDVRAMTYLEEEKGKTTLVLGVRESSIDLEVKVKRDKGGEKVKLKFPSEEVGGRRKEKEAKKKGINERPAEEQKQEELPYCRVAADPEHERGYREEEPCDDGRTGKIDKG